MYNRTEIAFKLLEVEAEILMGKSACVLKEKNEKAILSHLIKAQTRLNNLVDMVTTGSGELFISEDKK